MRMESNEEEREILSLILIKRIANFTEPGNDPDDDAGTLVSLIEEAKAILAL